ncbi:MAG TPA: DUF4159 domain-containing protein, partial [Alphaproteobacteria bacterium]|nr:DUF4159 domain-containing protein [Alphaproteobacteria bacterium]
VLAEPAPDLREKTWASLTDGTPLVTAQSRGEGRIVLVHVTANAAWSDLPLSGVFVDMLARLVRIGQGKGADLPADAVLPPRQVLDGFGRLQEPPPGIASLTSDMEPEALGPENPPGYYGSPETGVRAWNLANAVQSLTPLTRLPGGVTERSYGTERSRDFGGWLWVAAFFLLLADFAASLILRGHARLPSPTGAAALLFVFLGSAGTAEANTEQEALRATMETHLAYVETGNPDIDRTSADGLKGLSWVLTDRTSVEPGEPIGVNIETSELAFYPLLYWPVTPEQSLPSANARDRVARYMEQGGTVLFDTRDQQRSGPAGVGFGTTPERQHLRQILEGIRVPPLIPVPSDHVLTKAFYLLQEFPGRYAGGTLWLEANADAARDGVSSVMIGGHDWAAAWAVGVNGMPRFPVIPGGDRQREFAYRFGVNLVMHVLTGNYKGDQVHVPSILERLGQ